MEDEMPGTYKISEIVGTSPVSFAEAVKSAVHDAGKTIRQMDWFEVVEMRGHIKEGNVDEFQVKIKVGHRS
jgi:dodecin